MLDRELKQHLTRLIEAAEANKVKVDLCWGYSDPAATNYKIDKVCVYLYKHWGGGPTHLHLNGVCLTTDAINNKYGSLNYILCGMNKKRATKDIKKLIYIDPCPCKC